MNQAYLLGKFYQGGFNETPVHSLTHSLTRLLLALTLVLPSISGVNSVTADNPPNPTPLPTPIPPNLNNSDNPKTDDGGSESPNQRRNGPSAIYRNQMALPPLDSNCADGECVFAVGGPNDDAGIDPRFGGCAYTTSANEIYVGRCANGTDVVSGFRFPNVTLAKNAKIEQAYLVFAVDGPYSNNQVVELRGDKNSYLAPTGAAPFSATSTPAGRPKTTAGAFWRISSSDVWELGEERQTVDITGIMKEITS